ncbi:hypothetical protein MUN74_03930 [Agromyces endophyticus]|uniref:hypothetical protein n=1 Tax=Agromyces sp. H17E-10 TaxID=2932244 RepID=UPI001FD5B4FE|nr:hypothetical protein [Agromyces sp. H17E-10]UOQ90074.1 hypothetical protein MUN74_03930 [Agromyces sp. H17E-10]
MTDERGPDPTPTDPDETDDATQRLDREGDPAESPEGGEPGPDANDVEADNPVEEDTIETVDPDNAPG